MEIRKKAKINKSVRKSTRCYAIHEGKVVTIKYKNKEIFNGWYDLPGGKIETGETGDECAKREFYEETGLTVTDIEKLLMFDNKFVCIKLLEEKYLNRILNCEKLKIKMIINDKEEIVDVIEY